MSTVHPDAIKHQVRVRVASLRILPYAELAQLPAWTAENIPFGDTVAELVTYRRALAGGELSIAVQCLPEGSRRGFLWIGVYAEGFRLRVDGQVIDMSDEERYEYM